VQIIEDAATEFRWGDYTKAAVKHGALSSVSVPITLHETPALSAALNIYSTRAHAFDPASVQSAATLASYAEHTLGNFHARRGSRELINQLAAALQTRSVIDQAEGVLMRDRGCTAEEAFGLLVANLSRTNRKLGDIAKDIVRSASAAT
jgi:hypothetical protein